MRYGGQTGRCSVGPVGVCACTDTVARRAEGCPHAYCAWRNFFRGQSLSVHVLTIIQGDAFLIHFISAVGYALCQILHVWVVQVWRAGPPCVKAMLTVQTFMRRRALPVLDQSCTATVASEDYRKAAEDYRQFSLQCTLPRPVRRASRSMRCKSVPSRTMRQTSSGPLV